MEIRKVNYLEEYKAEAAMNEELEAYAVELGFEDCRPVEIKTSTRRAVKAQVNWCAFGAVAPETAVAISKLLVKAAELAENYKYNGYEVVYR